MLLSMALLHERDVNFDSVNARPHRGPIAGTIIRADCTYIYIIVNYTISRPSREQEKESPFHSFPEMFRRTYAYV